MDIKIELEDSIRVEDELSIQAISSVWIYFPSQLSALRKARGIITEAGERMGLNFLTPLHKL